LRGDAYLINYTRRNVFIISLVISLCIFILLDLISIKLQQVYENFKYEQVHEIDNKDNNQEIMKKTQTNGGSKSEETKENIWQIEIPKINLVAPISEGTSQEVMLEFVGHFENTSTWSGNIGLAAHNRGYPINYFSRLKELKKGDKIIYKSKNGTKTYSVYIIKIIQDTDWSYLKKTKENKITLITCVEDKPNQRLCIQAVEIKEE